MIKKILIGLLGLIIFISILVSIFYLCAWLFPPLSKQLFLGVEKKCDTQKTCMIRLHEITPFKWDKAYFFSSDNIRGTYPDIKKITGITEDYQRGSQDMVFFIYKGKLIKYASFNQKYFYSYGYSPIDSGKKNDFFVTNETNKDKLKELHYLGNLDDFLKNDIEISYYEITPKNDLLNASCVINNYPQLSVKWCGFSFTNLDQIHLYNPKKNK